MRNASSNVSSRSIFSLAVAALAACQATSSGAGDVAGNPLTLATLYANTSAEYAAATRGVYAAAEAAFPKLLVDTSHTAALEQRGQRFADLPPAIILDVDETVLDNSPFEVRLIEDGTAYPTGWADWCSEAAAEPVPGALEFTQLAAASGVEVFYVTNRKEGVKKGTVENLRSLGFPLNPRVDTVLMRDGQPDWGSDKTSRRLHVAANYRIVMLFGDNTGDFLGLAGAKGSPEERMDAVGAFGDRWGRSWFMLPNPMYGYWDGAVLDDNYDRPADEIERRRVRAMDDKR
ncbi:MAG: HAD family acid phosphatase [Planctomycetota bacterium]